MVRLKQIILLTAGLIFYISALAQNTVIKGTVTDAKTKQPIPYATVVFTGSNKGGSTDVQGKYLLTTTDNSSQIRVSFVGYRAVIRNIETGKEQLINVALT